MCADTGFGRDNALPSPNICGSQYLSGEIVNVWIHLKKFYGGMQGPHATGV